MDIAIFIADSNGAFPVPASKGGAVSTLVEHLVEGANRDTNNRLTVTTYYDDEAFIQAEKYNNVVFNWIKRPMIIKALDLVLFRIIQTMFPKKKSLSYATLFSLVWYVFKGTRYLKKNSFDKVILENNIPIAWIIRLSKYRGEYYYHFHNIPRINANCQGVFANCKGILCVSKYVSRELMKDSSPLAPLRQKQLKVLYNCIDTDLFKPLCYSKSKEEICCKYGIPIEKKIIIFIGRLSKEKGVDVLLKSCARLDRDDFAILIVGSFIQGMAASDPYEDELRNLSRDLDGYVYFTGFIKQKDLPKIYSGVDLAVLPSMWDEPAGLTMVEALACGLPLITTESGGIPEYVLDTRAVLIKRDDNVIENIKNGISQMLDNIDIHRDLNQENVTTELYSSKKYYDNFLNLLSEN